MTRKYNKNFILDDRSREFAEEMGIKNMPYKTDVELMGVTPAIMNDYMIKKYPKETIAIKYRLPLSLVDGIMKDKVHGLIQGKVYKKKEARERMTAECGYNKKDIDAALRAVDGKYINSSQVDIQRTTEIDMQPLLDELSRFGINDSIIKARSLVGRRYLFRTKQSVNTLAEKLKDGVLLSSIDGYNDLKNNIKIRVKAYATAIADDTYVVNRKNIHVGLDIDEVKRFISRIS